MKKDADQVLAQIPKGEHSVVRLSIKTYEDRRYIHVRLWTRDDKQSDDWRPTARGIALEWDQAGGLCEGFRELEKLLEGASNGESQPS